MPNAGNGGQALGSGAGRAAGLGGKGGKAGNGAGAGAGADSSSGAGVAAGASSSAGSGSMSHADGKLGARCQADGDCDTGLVCLTAVAETLAHGGPAGGICTKACTDGSSVCRELDPAASCVPLDGSAMYCLEGCALGEPASGVVKCHERAEVACTEVFDYGSLAGSCASDDDCDSSSACNDGVCTRLRDACIPHCSSDADCGGGLHCDYSAPLSLLGTCRGALPQGKASGQSCSADDECRGACFPLEGDVSVCLFGCTYELTEACSEPAPSKAGSACVLPVSDPYGRGDAAVCLPLCDCDDDCGNSSLRCIAFSADSTAGPKYGRAGYCFSSSAGEGITCPGR